MTDVVKVAAYVPVTREFLDDCAVVRSFMSRAMDDAGFVLQTGRTRLTDLGVNWWRPWRLRWWKS